MIKTSSHTTPLYEERTTVTLDFKRGNEINERVWVFPDLCIVDVVNLVEDHPLQVPDDL